jgi:hypothetical protein
MIQVQSSAGNSSVLSPSVGYGRPKRGTPDYAARVRAQIARLAAHHAAIAAVTPAVPSQALKSVLVVARCEQVRRIVREGLRDSPWARVVEAVSVADGVEQVAREHPDLLVVDAPEAEVLHASGTSRYILVAGEVPRSGQIPGQPLALVARPLRPQRVVERVLALLAERAD